MNTEPIFHRDTTKLPNYAKQPSREASRLLSGVADADRLAVMREAQRLAAETIFINVRRTEMMQAIHNVTECPGCGAK